MTEDDLGAPITQTTALAVADVLANGFEGGLNQGVVALGTGRGRGSDGANLKEILSGGNCEPDRSEGGHRGNGARGRGAALGGSSRPTTLHPEAIDRPKEPPHRDEIAHNLIIHARSIEAGPSVWVIPGDAPRKIPGNARGRLPFDALDGACALLASRPGERESAVEGPPGAIDGDSKKALLWSRASAQPVSHLARPPKWRWGRSAHRSGLRQRCDLTNQRTPIKILLTRNGSSMRGGTDSSLATANAVTFADTLKVPSTKA